MNEHLHSVWDIMSRGACWHWDWRLLAPYMLGNVLTATAYFAIPWQLWRIARGRRGKWLTGDVALAGAFIALCGAGHLIGGVLLVFWGLYPFAVLWDFATGIVSWVFALRLRRKLRAIIGAPDAGEVLALKDFWEARKKDLERAPLVTPRPTDGDVVRQIERTIQVLDRALVEAGATA